MKRKNGNINQKKKQYLVSEEAVRFIRTYVLPIKHIESINDDTFDEIFDMAEEWELDMIDKNGNDKKDNPFMERDIMGMNFVTEISGQNGEPNLDDLNLRLGLKRR